MTVWQWMFLLLYLCCSAALAAYALHGLWLLRRWNKRVHQVRQSQRETIDSYWSDGSDQARHLQPYPHVTVQLPLYNEAEVAARLIDAVAGFNYPSSQFAIQVLDDSDDDSRALIDARCAYWRQRGITVSVLRRRQRTGYKAGALAAGLREISGPIVAIFDADFVPPSDFLRKAVPLMQESSDIACVQGRWEHLNREQNWLTRAQSIGIDGHFAIEQGARAWNGLYMNFNGTAALWRREAIDCSGGWQADTLTEDLDLSYRAQMAGYRIVYALDIPCPAEIPATADALKSQQRRWATGSIQTARKLLGRIWKCPSPLTKKIAATFHLTHYAVCLWMTLLVMLTWPVLAFVPFPTHGWLIAAWAVVLLSAVAPCLSYYAAGRVLGHARFTLRNIPGLIVLGSGLALNNAVAVLSGIWGNVSEFVRTPKSGSVGEMDPNGTSGRYRAPATRLWWAEIGLSVYCVSVLLLHVRYEKWLLGIFLGFYAIGFARLGFASRPRWFRGAAANRGSRVVTGEDAGRLGDTGRDEMGLPEPERRTMVG